MIYRYLFYLSIYLSMIQRHAWWVEIPIGDGDEGSSDMREMRMLLTLRGSIFGNHPRRIFDRPIPDESWHPRCKSLVQARPSIPFQVALCLELKVGELKGLMVEVPREVGDVSGFVQDWSKWHWWDFCWKVTPDSNQHLQSTSCWETTRVVSQKFI